MKKVIKDSPTAEAEVNEHDIILEVDGDALHNVSDLVDAVQAAGVEEKSLQLAILRRGQEQTLTMKPARHKAKPVVPEALKSYEQALGWTSNYDKFENVKIEDLEETVESLRETVEDLKEQIKEAAKKLEE